ncbi:MAG: 2-dehydropantoate 2-reductase [Deltaproteobacteria bacterium]|nr:2-dehydropantoate 2-reductase [Deltaproteobacteria bacterium]
MNIAVIGVGGVGGYFGGKLAQLLPRKSDLNIYFIARHRHLEEIKKNGLLLDTDDGQMICRPTGATDAISELPVLDWCLICVKSYDLENALMQLKDKIADRTMILPLLNGVDIYERIRSVIANGIVFPSCVYIGTHIEKPGKVTQQGGAGIIHFGKDPANDYVDPEIFRLLDEAQIRYNWTENPYIEIWSKFVFIGAFGLVTANFNKTLGEVMESEELSGYVKDIMREIVAITAKKNVALPPTIVDDSYLKGHNFPYELKTSFQRDVEITDKPDERDLFGGTVIRMGKDLGVPVKTTQFIYDALQQKKKVPK